MKSEQAYLHHILQCIGRIREDCSAGKDAVFGSATLRDAILRNVQILCESAQRLSEQSRAQHPEIHWRAIAGLRNALVHDYLSVDFETIWAIVERDMPGLETAVRDLLGQSESPP